MSFVFALGFNEDDITGLTPYPYLLKKEQDKTFYRIIQRLDKKNFNPKNQIIKENPHLKEIIDLDNELRYDELNIKLNTKHSKINFETFYHNCDKGTKSHLDRIIDNIKAKILEIIIDGDFLLFIRRKGIMENIYDEDIITVSKDKLSVKFDFIKQGNDLIYRLNIYNGTKRIKPGQTNTKIFTNSPASLIHDNVLYLFENTGFNANKVKPFLSKNEIIVREGLQQVFFKKFLMPAVRKFDYTIEGFEMKKIEPDITPELIIEETFTGKIIFTPVFRYGDFSVEYHKERQLLVNVQQDDNGYYLISVLRKPEAENKLLQVLKELGFRDSKSYFFVNKTFTDKYQFVEWFTPYVKKLTEAGYKITNNLFSSEVEYSFPEISYNTNEKTDWFDLNIIIKAGNNILKFVQLRNHILNRIPEYRFPDGKIFIIPSTWFSELFAFAINTGNDNITKLPKAQIRILSGNKVIRPDKTIQSRLKELETVTTPDLPSGLNATLRNYQKEGFQRLYHLSGLGYGVCLADDMGLGKTIQVITVLLKYFENKSLEKTTTEDTTLQLSLFGTEENNEDKQKTHPALIVVPKSLIFNWVEELKKFAPGLKYFVYQGANRVKELEKSEGFVHIILATYGILRQDIDLLRNKQFSYLILDESQAIKNPLSKTYNAAVSLNATARISITGTPIENNLTDLWAQMNFLNRNILGNIKFFETNFILPVTKFQENEREEELKKIVRPFIIRRKKKEVVSELPEKSEQTIYCPMTETQHSIYESEKSAVRNKFLKGEVNRKNIVQVLTVLNRLRQISLYPAMLPEYQNADSGKFETVIETMENLLQEGNKFLVFSSFVKHLNIYRDYFEKNNIPFSMLTGKDTKREMIVKEFQNDETIKPFLISIRAGGQGLNLTAASYVLLLDPWWNPAVEQQAIDRTHRIGQTQNVMVYRFITKDSIEEKIMRLQHKKRKLISNMIDSNQAATLNIEDFRQLLDI